MSRIKSFFTPPEMLPANGNSGEEDLSAYLRNLLRRQGFIIKVMVPFILLLAAICFVANKF